METGSEVWSTTGHSQTSSWCFVGLPECTSCPQEKTPLFYCFEWIADLQQKLQCSRWFSRAGGNKELITTLSSAREIAVSSLQAAQIKYKKYYDSNTRPLVHQVGDWILIRFPLEETGHRRKLSRSWYRPYRVVAMTEVGYCCDSIFTTGWTCACSC